MDRRVEALVLRQLADGAHVALAGIVDAGKVGGADAVGDGAEIGIIGDAGGKFLAPVGAHMHLAEKLHLDAEDRVVVFHPALLVGGHGIDEGDDAVAADGNGNEPADGPQFRERGLAAVGDGADGRARAVAGHDPAEQAIACLSVPAVLFACRHGGLEFIVEQRGTPCHQPPRYRCALNKTFRVERLRSRLLPAISKTVPFRNIPKGVDADGLCG